MARISESGESREFAARYPGICVHGDRIEEGDLVQYVDDELQHVECRASRVAEHLTRPARALCPKCYLELSVDGTCGMCD